MNSKPPLLFLAHRIPFPPNKGDKIRSFHLLKHLSDSFDVYLATYVDDPDDWRYCAAVSRYCADAIFIDRTSLMSWAPSVISGFFDGSPLSCAYYRSRRLQAWVSQVIEQHGITRSFLFCSPMGQFLVDRAQSRRTVDTTIIDLVDVDSEKWSLYSKSQTGLKRWLFRLESRRLFAEEKKLVEAASCCYLVSDREAEMLRSKLPGLESKIEAFDNGVDFEFFDPSLDLPNPYCPGDEVIVFTGAMDYYPNVDAITWFADRVFPNVRSLRPRAKLYVVGRNPAPSVCQLQSRDGVVVTGGVQDVRPYLKFAKLAVAPLRIARGVQNKVLEALSMDRPVLATEAGFEGVDERLRKSVAIEDCPATSAAVAVQILAGSSSADAARATIIECYRWERTLEPLKRKLMDGPPQLSSGSAHAG